tara:strand:- start:460 stop:1113 length:654 start_codon:yes stop_codon:yes gene_type:complete
MAGTSVWYPTEMPDLLMDNIRNNLVTPIEDGMVGNLLAGDANVDPRIRTSQVSWVEAHNWIGGFIMSYVLKANRDNFHYDIKGIERGGIQYSKYGVKGHYGWHTDQSLETFYESQSIDNNDNPGDQYILGSGKHQDFIINGCENVRKLSFSFQMSCPDSYEGGNLQFLSDTNNKIYNAPRAKGMLIIFDSRMRHRVTKVRSGYRESLVGWVYGPRWK